MAVGSRDANNLRGSARVYENQNGTWEQVGSTIYGEEEGDTLGRYLDMNQEGDLIIVGASYHDFNGSNSGQAKIYQLQSSEWQQIGSTLYGSSTDDWFGRRVAMSLDGKRIIVTAPNEGEGIIRIFDIKED